jgi:hypothetical protein
MTKRLDKLQRGYPKLTVHERVELLLAAKERHDVRDAERLDGTCPSADLHPYIDRLLALQHSACILVVQLLARQVLLVRKFQDLVGDADPIPPPDPDLISILKGQAAIWRGFVAWCQDMRHDPRRVLLMAPLGLDGADPAYFIIQEQIACLEALAQGMEALLDPDEIQMWQGLFALSFSH